MTRSGPGPCSVPATIAIRHPFAKLTLDVPLPALPASRNVLRQVGWQSAGKAALDGLLLRAAAGPVMAIASVLPRICFSPRARRRRD